MQKTTNYNQFISVSNRDVNESHVKRLVKSMRTIGFDETHPLRVTETAGGRLALLDGQHRLEAAKRLALPVMYQVIDVENPSTDVYYSNAFNRSWTTNDFFSFWVRRGSEDYINLKIFMEESSLPLRTARMLIPGQKQMAALDNFKLGKFIFDDDSRHAAQQRMGLINEVRNFTGETRDLTNHQAFVNALAVLVSNPSYNHKRFLNGLGRISYRLKKYSRQYDYLQLFQDIYNYNHKIRYLFNNGVKWTRQESVSELS